LLNGLGGTAYGFDDFASKLTDIGHVYGITRRGSGASSAPASGYGADRLGDDVIAVMESLKIQKPVLVGESLGGEELSSVGSRYPDRVAGLVYLDAAYQYAFDNGKGTTIAELQKAITPQIPPQNESDRATFTALQAWYTRVAGFTLPEAELRQTFDAAPDGSVGAPRVQPSYADTILAGMQKYTDIRAPALAIFAIPHDLGPGVNRNLDAKARDALEAADIALTEKQAKAFEDGVPTALVVRLPHANHVVYSSNEADVLKEMRTFLAALH
jgi:pimeloyl-ACP methyl ester carboxylesterase